MDVEVGFEDQQNINLFSKANQRLTHVELLLASKKRELEEIEDSLAEVQLLAELDEFSDAEDEPTGAPETAGMPYRIGDVFVSLPVKAVLAKLKESKARLEGVIGDYEHSIQEHADQLRTLKALLYGKFKGAINLER